MFHLSMAIASYRSFGFAITRIWPIQPDYLTRIDRSCLRLLHEATHAIVIACNFSRQDLQRDFPIQFRVLRQIHFAHAALADLRADFVAAESAACGECRRSFTNYRDVRARLAPRTQIVCRRTLYAKCQLCLGRLDNYLG